MLTIFICCVTMFFMNEKLNPVIGFRADKDFRRTLENLAKKESRPLSYQVIYMLKLALKDYQL